MKPKRSMTRSPVALARMALRVSRDALPAHSSKFSKKDFTQHQLFPLLILKQFFKTDYRGIVQLLRDLPDLQRFLELKKVPHYSTLKYAQDRLLKRGLSTNCSPPFSMLRERVA